MFDEECLRLATHFLGSRDHPRFALAVLIGEIAIALRIK